MTITLILLAVLMGVVVWWLLRHSINAEPWAEQSPFETIRDRGALTLPPVKVALGVFLAVATSLFALFISAYAMRMDYPDWHPVPEPKLLWLNTGVLMVTSLAMQWTRAAAQQGNGASVRIGLATVGLLTFAFLGGQLAAWQQLNAEGYFLATNPANAFFYLLTAVHGVHLLGGLWVWIKTSARIWRGVSIGKIRVSVELCSVYWHYLLLVWLILFGVLLAT